LFEDGDSTITRLAELKALGVHLAIDDFGTGFSSLSYLQRYPIDSLKIDKSFVDAMDTSRGAELVRTVIELGSVLGITTVAEGIEHSAQLDALQALGCQLGQGFMFSRPVPDAQVGALLEADAAGREARTTLTVTIT
ncbi:MAG TPA: EAL domain-containing protein, partial [Acidimicrobiia bacterium]|nr:EAL domain-containing protein [Acidimicrobiia bacterium]